MTMLRTSPFNGAVFAAGTLLLLSGSDFKSYCQRSLVCQWRQEGPKLFPCTLHARGFEIDVKGLHHIPTEKKLLFLPSTHTATPAAALPSFRLDQWCGRGGTWVRTVPSTLFLLETGKNRNFCVLVQFGSVLWWPGFGSVRVWVLLEKIVSGSIWGFPSMELERCFPWWSGH